MHKSIAVCPGSFDPITVGHVDIIKRAAKMFDRVIVVVMVNPKKTYSFTPEERVSLVRAATADLENIEVDYSDGLLAEYAREKGASVIIKGLRAMSDFEYEFQMALANKKLNSEVETVFFPGILKPLSKISSNCSSNSSIVIIFHPFHKAFW